RRASGRQRSFGRRRPNADCWPAGPRRARARPGLVGRSPAPRTGRRFLRRRLHAARSQRGAFVPTEFSQSGPRQRIDASDASRHLEWRHMLPEVGFQFLRIDLLVAHDYRDEDLTGFAVDLAEHQALLEPRVAIEDLLDLDRIDEMAGDVQRFRRASGDPQEAVGRVHTAVPGPYPAVVTEHCLLQFGPPQVPTRSHGGLDDDLSFDPVGQLSTVFADDAYVYARHWRADRREESASVVALVVGDAARLGRAVVRSWKQSRASLERLCDGYRERGRVGDRDAQIRESARLRNLGYEVIDKGHRRQHRHTMVLHYVEDPPWQHPATEEQLASEPDCWEDTGGEGRGQRR